MAEELLWLWVHKQEELAAQTQQGMQVAALLQGQVAAALTGRRLRQDAHEGASSEYGSLIMKVNFLVELEKRKNLESAQHRTVEETRSKRMGEYDIGDIGV